MGGSRVVGTMRRFAVGFALFGLVTVSFGPVAHAGTARSARSTPVVTGPVSGGKGVPTLSSTTFDLSSVGYTQAEFFLEGTATAYTSLSPLTSNGRWTVEPQATAPYKTRIVVYRPASAKKFDGTVFVEWLNVSPGFDNAPDWLSGHNAIIRDGAAWVGVSAQPVGIQNLVASDPDRYASLSHPGTSYAYDIFTQAGVAARKKTTPAVLGGLRAKRVIATAESQSAWYLVSYVDALQPIAHAYDGFLVHSSRTRPASLSTAPLADLPAPNPTLVRADLDVPVLALETETDVVGFGGTFVSRQPDTKRFRLWEIAGASHADFYQAGPGRADTGDGKVERMLLDTRALGGGALGCQQPINYGPQYMVLNAALHRLNRWVTDGVAPPLAARLDVKPGTPPVINRDAYGNARGGVRTPLVDVPIARLDGDRNAGSLFCFLFGHTVPLDSAALSALYPTHRAYVDKFTQATRAAVKAGFVLPSDAARLVAAARASAVGAS